MDLSVIILNWNTRALLEQCLRSLLAHGSGIDVQIIVVDNASSDDSRAMVSRLFPEVQLICNRRNIGFGAGNNVALPAALGRYILFLNSDTVVTEGALAAMVHHADAEPDIGVLGPKLLNGDGSLQYSCRHFPNLGTGFFRNTPLGRLFPNNRFTNDYLMQNWDHAEPRDVDWVSGAALMIRRALVEEIGGFDEDFYMYCEDVDLCWRTGHTPLSTRGDDSAPGGPASASALSGAVKRSWRVAYYPQAVIYHFIGRSSDFVPTRMTYEFHRSQYLFYKKHFSASTPLLLRPIIPLGIVLRALGKIVRYRLFSWKKLRAVAREKRNMKNTEADVESTAAK